MRKKLLITIVFGLIIAAFFIAENFVLAAIGPLPPNPPGPPTVAFTGGDDTMQNGGVDDPYDAVIIFQLIPSVYGPDGYQMEYSNNGGQSWNAIVARYETATNKYFWSTSGIYAPTLLFRVRAEYDGVYTGYVYATLALFHRATNHNSRYFVEDFTTVDFKGAGTDANWDTGRALVELAPNPPTRYHPNSSAYSTNLLAGISNQNVLGVTFQPVGWSFGEILQYQLSNNGLDWYGDTSGITKDNVWFSFAGEILPAAVYVPFNDTIGTGLYWRASLKTNNTYVTPQIYQLRFQWQENIGPQACFMVEPAQSYDPEQTYSFNASCSSDYEDAMSLLDYRWDFNSDGTWELDWFQGQYSPDYVYGSTSTQSVLLEVRDAYGLTDDFTGQVNASGTAGRIFGWAWSSNFGWTSLSCDNIYYDNSLNLCPPDYGLTIYPNNVINGWAWDNNIGWLCFGSTCAAYGNPPLGGPAQMIYDSNNGQISGWGKYLTYGEQSEDGWLYLRGNWCDAGPDEDECVYIDLDSQRIYGYAWNGFKDQEVLRGVGWLRFYGNINMPWLETKYGLVYGRGNVGSPQTYNAPDERYSATYCIRAGGEILHFSSEAGCLESGYDDLGFPAVSNRYRTILGVVDPDDILIKHEAVVFASDDVDQSLSAYGILGNGVYHFTGFEDYYISEITTFYNARNLDSAGAGTIIIDGNLHINKNLYYENSAVTSQIENLASVAWIVRGDVIIDELVSNVVGDFIVIGPEPAVACVEPGPSGCGEFRTGDDSLSPKQLVVNGLVMARKMYFERYFKQGGEPAEKIIYDGRVIVNTPPGLENVAKGLPVWREAMVSTEIE